MRCVRMLGFVLAMLALPPVIGRAAAADLRLRQLPEALKSAPAQPPTSAMRRGGDPGPQERRDRHDDGREHGGRPGHHRRVIIVPQTVFVTPSRCWQPGYWTYQFVPQYYTYSAWVAGQWSPDGRWIDGHYAPAQYSSGYYQPLWVEGYYTACD